MEISVDCLGMQYKDSIAQNAGTDEGNVANGKEQCTHSMEYSRIMVLESNIMPPWHYSSYWLKYI